MLGVIIFLASVEFKHHTFKTSASADGQNYAKLSVVQGRL